MTMNKVWIEIQIGTDAENEERANLLNKMIGKLHHNEDDRKLQQTFSWSKHDQKYHLRLGPSGMYRTLEDKGEWFNLDYFAGDD